MDGEPRALVAVKEAPLATRRTRDLVADLVRQGIVLLRAEARLLRLDITDAAKRAETRAKLTGTAIAMMHTGVVLVAISMFLGLREVLPAWLGALCAGLVFLAGGLVVLARRDGTNRKTLKENDDGRAEEPRT